MTIKNVALGFVSEPLVRFFAIGVALFVLYQTNGPDITESSGEIVLDSQQLQLLSDRFEKAWGRLPSPGELQDSVDTWIREEVFFREGLALGLHRGDPVIRRRVVQNLGYLGGRLAASDPTDKELRDWLQAHSDDYVVPAKYNIQQIYFDPSRRRDGLQRDIENALRLAAAGKKLPVSDSSLLPPTLSDAEYDRTAGVFGEVFADTVAELPTNEWVGPVESVYGQHLVRLEKIREPRLATLEEARAALERDLAFAREREYRDSMFEALRSKYRIFVAGVDTLGRESGRDQ